MSGKGKRSDFYSRRLHFPVEFFEGCPVASNARDVKAPVAGLGLVLHVRISFRRVSRFTPDAPLVDTAFKSEREVDIAVREGT